MSQTLRASPGRETDTQYFSNGGFASGHYEVSRRCLHEGLEATGISFH